MIEFENDQFQDLLDKDGVLLTDCKGQWVAICEGFDYDDVFAFIHDFINQYGIEELSECLGFSSADEFLKRMITYSWTEDQLLHDVMFAFYGKRASDLEDRFEYPDPEEQARLEAADHKCDELAGR